MKAKTRSAIGTWEKVRPPLSTDLADVRRRVGKEIAHLTYVRVSNGRISPTWRFGNIANDLRQVVRAFCKNVPRDRLGDRMRRFF